MFGSKNLDKLYNNSNEMISLLSDYHNKKINQSIVKYWIDFIDLSEKQMKGRHGEHVNFIHYVLFGMPYYSDYNYDPLSNRLKNYKEVLGLIQHGKLNGQDINKIKDFFKKVNNISNLESMCKKA